MTELVATRSLTLHGRSVPRPDGQAVAVWGLVSLLVLYLAFDGGGYDIVTHSQVGIIVWWVVLIALAARILPTAGVTRLGLAALGLFGGFVGWTALATTWSISTERSLQDLSLVACYLGVLALAIFVHRDRESALRHTVNAVATAIVIVAALALFSRLRPGTFAHAGQTAAFLPGEANRLSWPLNYWNALATLIVLGLPLLLSITSSARTLLAQAAAAAVIPLLMLTAYLTFSRGALLAGGGALVVFFLLAPDRIPKLVTGVVTGLGSAALVAGAVHRHALEHGLTNSAAHHQGTQELIAVVLVCAGTAVVQAGIGLGARHGTLPRWLRISPRRALIVFLTLLAIGIVVAIAAGGPGHLSHAWQDFKRPKAAATSDQSLSRFTTANGEGRYQYWQAAVNSLHGHLLGGSGPGTFQLLWLPRAPFQSYVVNAHSLYVETLAETGVVGLALLVGFLVLLLGAGVRTVVRSRFETRTRAAAAVAALVAFLISAAFDWMWQMPVLPAAFMLLAASLLAPGRTRHPDTLRPRRLLTLRVGAAAVAAACLFAIAFPLAETTALRRSETAATRGQSALALTDARDAVRIEPGAALAQLQLALVLEQQHDLSAALTAVRRATSDEATNWETWLIRSRIEAETGHPQASVATFQRARSLNPQSPVFASLRRSVTHG